MGRKKLTSPSMYVQRAIRFDNSAQLETIQRAAARRGFSFNAFVIQVTAGAADRILNAPPEDILGDLFRKPSDNSTERVRKYRSKKKLQST
jgi:hypothetical protein